MENEFKEIFQSRGIDVPDADFPVLKEVWSWISSLKEESRGMPSGSYDIAVTHVVRKGKIHG